jgi:WD40 repeat protein
LAFSPDGKLVACHGRGKNVDLWHVQTGQLRGELIGHLHPVCAAAFSPDGKTLVSGAEDRTVRLWDIRGGECLATLMILPSKSETEVSADWIAFTSEGYYDGSAKVGRLIRWRAGNEPLPAGRYERAFHRPDLVEKELRREK